MLSWKIIASRIRGLSFSLTGAGLSFRPSRPEAEIAQELITFLEDRGVLFDDYQIEVVPRVVASVHDIRKELTTLLRALPNRRGFPQHMRVMRGACRQFLSKAVGTDGQPIIKH